MVSGTKFQFPDSQGVLQEQKADPSGTNIDRAEYLLYALGSRPVGVPQYSHTFCRNSVHHVQQNRQNKNTRILKETAQRTE